MASDKKLQDLGEVHLCVEAYVIYQGNVLMHRRSKTKKHFPGYLIGPGGHINEGEDVPRAACREIEEETGIIVPPNSLKLKFIGIHHHTDTHTVWVNWGYLSKPTSIEGELRQSDEGTSEWIDYGKLMKIKDSVFPPSSEYFDHLLNDTPGVLYTSSEWSDNHLVRTLSKNILEP
jgi:8-oxo-dGTP pyrophosphatase MutT (NUDIX family)